MPLSPLDIKVELIRKGVTMSAIARELEPPVSANHVSKVVAGERRSPRIEAAIAEKIGRAVDEVFEPKAATAAA